MRREHGSFSFPVVLCRAGRRNGLFGMRCLFSLSLSSVLKENALFPIPSSRRRRPNSQPSANSPQNDKQAAATTKLRTKFSSSSNTASSYREGGWPAKGKRRHFRDGRDHKVEKADGKDERLERVPFSTQHEGIAGYPSLKSTKTLGPGQSAGLTEKGTADHPSIAATTSNWLNRR